MSVTEGETTKFFLEFVGGRPERTVGGYLGPVDESIASVSPYPFSVAPMDYPLEMTLTGLMSSTTSTANRATTLGGVVADCGSDEGASVFVISKGIQNVLASNWNMFMAPSSSTSFDVALTQAPTSVVTVTLNTAPAGLVQFTPSSLTLGPSDYNVGHTVTITSGLVLGSAYVGLHPDSGIQSQGVGVTVMAAM